MAADPPPSSLPPDGAAQLAGAGAAVAPLPPRRLLWANLIWTQAAWFAAVLGAAHGRPVLGSLPVLAGLGWHLATVRRPGPELRLVLCATLLGTLADAVPVQLGAVAYAHGQWSAALPPFWLSGLWAAFATSLNLTLRWLHGRPWLAALLGAVAGPLAFSSGVRLGGAQFVDAPLALGWLALEWALLLPLLCWLGQRLDGAAGPATVRAA